MTDSTRPPPPEEWPPDALIDAGRQLRAAGRPEEALAAFEIATRKAPDALAAWSGLALANFDLTRYHLAAAAFERAVELAPGDANLWRNLGHVRLLAAWPAPAAQALERAVALDPSNIGAWDDLGNSYGGMWDRAKESAAAYDRALALDPTRIDILSRRLVALAFDEDLSDEGLWEAHRAFGAKVEALAGVRAPVFAMSRAPERRLKVGYVSGNLYAHIMSAELRTVFARHDRAAFDITVYDTSPTRDAVTQELRALVPDWRVVPHLDDEALADAIRADGVDILVHSMGHWQNNRLGVVARRAAPVQIEYLSQSPAVGLSACDANLIDPWLTAGDALARLSADRNVELPSGCFSTSMLPDLPVPPPPRLRTGRLTFASFNRVAKISRATVRRWAAVLARSPDARLLVKIPERFDGAEEARMRADWAALGLDVSRVELRGHAEGGDYWTAFADADLLLDCVPFNGGRTTTSGAWMGIPTVSEKGRPIYGRLGHCLMSRLGLGDLVAEDEAGYVASASALASDPARLDAIRGTLRARFAASTLVDSARHVRELEAVYRDLWRAYCVNPAGADR
jgi:predicted O-linked N-acetylglucosamine transferase (SPINDLY family)